MSQSLRKIGILTYTSNFNLGTFFQAYAALCSVRRNFPDARVEVVNYNSKTKYERVGYDKLNLKKRHVYPPYLIRHLVRQKLFRGFQDRFLEIETSRGLISDSYSEATEYLKNQSYDLLLVGSDTVLNFYDWNFTQGEPPIYWLPPELNTTKVMLAASIGTDLSLDHLNPSLRAALAKSAKGFALLGVRDSMTRKFLLEMAPELESRIELVPDPTFSFDIDHSHAKSYLKRRGIDPNIPMIGLDLPISVPGVRKAIQHFKSKGYQIVSCRDKSKVADYGFTDTNLFQWAGMFAYYSITLTSRFHALVFSLKNRTPVIGVDYQQKRVSASGQSKISLLLEDFGIKETNYCNASRLTDKNWFLHTMESILATPPTEKIAAELESRRIAYKSYLEKAHDLLTK